MLFRSAVEPIKNMVTQMMVDNMINPVFMHRPAQRNMSLKRRAGRAASRGRWLFPTRLRSPMQRKYAAEAADARGFAEENAASQHKSGVGNALIGFFVKDFPLWILLK